MAKVFDLNKTERANIKGENQAEEPPLIIENGVTEKSNSHTTSVGPAYKAYLESRKNLALMFKEREYRDEEAYREAERQYRLCSLAIDQAVKKREKAELEAANLYQEELDRAINKASQTYKNKTKQAMIDCKQKVIDAWKNSMEASENTTVVCEESIEKAMQAREKIEIESLIAYRQEVDKAVEKTSQIYKDRITRALFECKQRIMDAWENSLETSTQMTGVFEEDKILNPVNQPSPDKVDFPKTEINNSLLKIKTNVLTTFHKVRRELVEKHAEE